MDNGLGAQAPYREKITQSPQPDNYSFFGVVNKTRHYKTLRIGQVDSVNNLASILGKNYPRFCTWCGNLRRYNARYIVCSFSIDEFLTYEDDIYTGRFLLDRLEKLESAYQLPVLFCNSPYGASDRICELLINTIFIG